MRVFSQENVCDRIKALQVNSLAASLGMYVRYKSRCFKFLLVYLLRFKVQLRAHRNFPKPHQVVTAGS